jgi:hypothetical protein
VLPCATDRDVGNRHRVFGGRETAG